MQRITENYVILTDDEADASATFEAFLDEGLNIYEAVVATHAEHKANDIDTDFWEYLGS